MNSELPARSKCVLNDHMNNMAADRHLFEYWISAAKPWGRIHSAVRGWQRRMVWQAVVSDSLLLKRLIDLAVASAALLALSPLFGLVVLVIKLDDRGPIFFCQQRVGLRGRTFAMWKFRSMRCDAEILKACLAQHNEIAGGVMFQDEEGSADHMRWQMVAQVLD
jgi:hypothetical protein